MKLIGELKEKVEKTETKEEVDILVQRNLDSGNLETGIPDAGNRLNSA